MNKILLHKETVEGHPANLIDIPGSNAFHYRIDFSIGAIWEELDSEKDLHGIYHLNELLNWEGTEFLPRPILATELPNLTTAHSSLTDFNSTVYSFESVSEHAEEVIKLAHNIAFNPLTSVTNDRFTETRNKAIAVARRRYGNPDIYFFDHGLAALLGLTPGCNTYGTSESLSNITLADCIATKAFQMENARIVHNIIYDSKQLTRAQIFEMISVSRMLPNPKNQTDSKYFEVFLLPGSFKMTKQGKHDMVMRAIHSRVDNNTAPIMANTLMEYLLTGGEDSLRPLLIKSGAAPYVHGAFRQVGARDFFYFICPVVEDGRTKFYEAVEKSLKTAVNDFTLEKYELFTAKLKMKQDRKRLDLKKRAEDVFNIITNSDIVQESQIEIDEIENRIFEEVINFDSFSEGVGKLDNFAKDRLFAQVDTFS